MTRIYSQLLSMAMDSHNDTLFTFDYSMPEEYRPIFEHKFLLRFGYRNINFDSYQMFKRMLESRLIEIMPRYLKLYESENVKFNPFVNTRNKTNAFQRDKGRTKNYETANNKSHNYNSNSGSTSGVSRGGTTSGDTESSLTTNNAVNKQRGINDRGSSKLNLFADTPQTQAQTEGSSGGGSSDGNGAGDKYFNDGYITTATRDRESATEINSGSSNAWSNQAGEQSRESYETSGSTENVISQNKALAGGVSYGDREAVAAEQRTRINDVESEGLNGVLMSEALNEWRKTFINIDQMLLDECEDLFMGIF